MYTHRIYYPPAWLTVSGQWGIDKWFNNQYNVVSFYLQKVAVQVYLIWKYGSKMGEGWGGTQGKPLADLKRTSWAEEDWTSRETDRQQRGLTAVVGQWGSRSWCASVVEMT